MSLASAVVVTVSIILSYRSKVDKISDIITGNPTVIKMVIHYTR